MTPEEIQRACARLAAERLNAWETEFVESIRQRSRWSDKQIAALKNTLKKYKIREESLRDGDDDDDEEVPF